MRPYMKSKYQRGFTLVEAMVALTIGLILLTFMSLVFVENGKYRNDLDRSSRMIENGSYALQRIGGDAMMAGLYAELDVASMMGKNPVTTLAITSEPDACDASTLDKLRAGLPFAVQGYAAPDAATLPTLPTACTTLLADAKAGSDILVVRHTEPCTPGDVASQGIPACDPVVAGAAYFQATHCADEAQTATKNRATVTGISCSPNNITATSTSWCALDSDTSTAKLNLHEIGLNCSTSTTYAAYHRYYVDIWFVANNDVGTDGIPTLKLAQLGSNGTVPTFGTPVAIAEGIETMQLEYGLDYSAGPPVVMNGTPQAYTADPDTYSDAAHSLCTGSPTTCPGNWANVMSVKIHLLGRNSEATPVGYTNDKTYTLGLKADGTANTFGFAEPSGSCGSGVSCVKYLNATKYKRHVYESTVRVRNPSDRRTTS